MFALLFTHLRVYLDLFEVHFSQSHSSFSRDLVVVCESGTEEEILLSVWFGRHIIP